MKHSISAFIEAHIDLIETEDFETLYIMADNSFFFLEDVDQLTRCLHDAEIYPELKLKTLPLGYIDHKNNFENHLDAHPILFNNLINRNENHSAVKVAKEYKRRRDAEDKYAKDDPPPYIYNKQTASDYKFVMDYIKEIIIEDTVTIIPDMAFAHSPRLVKVHLGEKVKKLGMEAFVNCPNLVEINFPSSLRTIGVNCFYGAGFTEISIPNTVIDVRESVFAKCTKLNRIVFSDTMQTIPELICSGCSLLSEVIIPEGITVINSRAFSGCVSLSNIVLPKSVETIGDCAFRSCTGLISFDASNVGSIGGNAFELCQSLVDFEMNNVAVIGNRAFGHCTNLREIRIPVSCKVLGHDVFANCDNSLKVYYDPHSTGMWAKGWDKKITAIPQGA